MQDGEDRVVLKFPCKNGSADEDILRQRSKVKLAEKISELKGELESANTEMECLTVQLSEAETSSRTYFRLLVLLGIITIALLIVSVVFAFRLDDNQVQLARQIEHQHEVLSQTLALHQRFEWFRPQLQRALSNYSDPVEWHEYSAEDRQAFSLYWLISHEEYSQLVHTPGGKLVWESKMAQNYLYDALENQPPLREAFCEALESRQPSWSRDRGFIDAVARHYRKRAGKILLARGDAGKPQCVSRQ